MKWLKGQQATVPTAEEAAAAVGQVERDREALRGRAADITVRLERARTRESELARQVASMVIAGDDNKALVALRRDRRDAAIEVEELELALAGATDRLTALDEEHRLAGRRLQAVLAMEQLDRVAELAAQVDEAMAVLPERVERLLLAADDAAGLLNRLYGATNQNFFFWRTLFSATLLQPLARLIDLPHPMSAIGMRSVGELLSFTQVRATLAAELGGGTAQ